MTKKQFALVSLLSLTLAGLAVVAYLVIAQKLITTAEYVQNNPNSTLAQTEYGYTIGSIHFGPKPKAELLNHDDYTLEGLKRKRIVELREKESSEKAAHEASPRPQKYVPVHLFDVKEYEKEIEEFWG